MPEGEEERKPTDEERKELMDLAMQYQLTGSRAYAMFDRFAKGASIDEIRKWLEEGIQGDEEEGFPTYEEARYFNNWLREIIAKYNLSREDIRIMIRMFLQGVTLEEIEAYAIENQKEPTIGQLLDLLPAEQRGIAMRAFRRYDLSDEDQRSAIEMLAGGKDEYAVSRFASQHDQDMER